MKRLALYNFGMFKLAASDPANQGFHDRNDPNFLAAEQADGFIARSGYEDEPGPAELGRAGLSALLCRARRWLVAVNPVAVAGPRLADGVFLQRHSRRSDAPRARVVRQAGMAGLRPVVGGAAIIRRTGPRRSSGSSFCTTTRPSPFAFDFKTPFDEDGKPAAIDREMVKRDDALECSGNPPDRACRADCAKRATLRLDQVPEIAVEIGEHRDRAVGLDRAALRETRRLWPASRRGRAGNRRFPGTGTRGRRSGRRCASAGVVVWLRQAAAARPARRPAPTVTQRLPPPRSTSSVSAKPSFRVYQAIASS